MEKAVSFKNSKGQRLLGILHIPETSGKHPAVICCHGFAGDKIGKYRLRVRLARSLCEKGFVVFRFDFSGHGDSEGELDDISVVQELDDLECAIKFLKKQPAVDTKRIGAVGHSLGGEIVILEAAKNHFDHGRKAFEDIPPQNPEIKAIVLFAPVADYRKFAPDHMESFEAAEKYGFAERASHKIKKRYFDEMKQFRPLDEISKISAPVLVIHGDADDRVDISGSKELVRKANAPKKLVVIPGADHSFLGYEITTLLISETTSWFSEHLKK